MLKKSLKVSIRNKEKIDIHDMEVQRPNKLIMVLT
jgi:hypothetical protein